MQGVLPTDEAALASVDPSQAAGASQALGATPRPGSAGDAASQQLLHPPPARPAEAVQSASAQAATSGAAAAAASAMAPPLPSPSPPPPLQHESSVTATAAAAPASMAGGTSGGSSACGLRAQTSFNPVGSSLPHDAWVSSCAPVDGNGADGETTPFLFEHLHGLRPPTAPLPKEWQEQLERQLAQLQHFLPPAEFPAPVPTSLQQGLLPLQVTPEQSGLLEQQYLRSVRRQEAMAPLPQPPLPPPPLQSQPEHVPVTMPSASSCGMCRTSTVGEARSAIPVNATVGWPPAPASEHQRTQLASETKAEAPSAGAADEITEPQSE